MRGLLLLCAFVGLIRPAFAQYQIWDIWQTVWDRSHLYTNLKPSTPINFGSPGAIGAADIEVDDSSTFQSVWGFGGSLTDSSATILSNMKSAHPTQYQQLMEALFDPTDGAQSAGLSFVRVPIGASDFSAREYSLDDSNGDTSFSQFNINNQPSNVFDILGDIQNLNRYLRVIICPWSPPAWMKTGGTMNGGSLTASLATQYATYFLKAVQGFQSKGINVYGVSIQNEPENVNDSYPTCDMPVNIMAQIGTQLRTLLNNNGFPGVKVLGYDHNWSDAANYPVQLMQQAGNAFDGVQFHCYAGTVGEQDSFHTAFPNKQIYFTECSGTYGTDWWSDIKWYMDNMWVRQYFPVLGLSSYSMIGSIEHNSHSGMMWNIALDGTGNPKLPGTTSCGGSTGPGCRPIVTVNSDGSLHWRLDYSMAQASRGILPRDAGGPFGIRIGVSVGGELNWALRVGAYVTKRNTGNPNEWWRYSLVVLNWDDSASTTWNPQPVQATIEFRGTQATYTFPVGVTTLWWYAPPTATSVKNQTIIPEEPDQHPFTVMT
ncbi:glycoside hydrolase [Vararia minispora EC-137]|uniref:Glycoside hydrolase n=1 Tax=Vararia minispora EC-137 TaxID=1314806 RepID=A0ACB8QFT5_9AGAM|nr:glycoside hydrolase [Vararia minispora EC-137]